MSLSFLRRQVQPRYGQRKSLNRKTTFKEKEKQTKSPITMKGKTVTVVTFVNHLVSHLTKMYLAFLTVEAP